MIKIDGDQEKCRLAVSFLHGLQICATWEGDCRVPVWGGPGWEFEAQAESGTSGERAEGRAGESKCREREDAGWFGEPRCILFYYWSTVLVNCLSYQPCTFLLPVPVIQPVFNCCLKVTAKTLTQHDELMKKTETMNVLMETNKLAEGGENETGSGAAGYSSQGKPPKNSQLFLLVEILL